MNKYYTTLIRWTTSVNQVRIQIFFTLKRQHKLKKPTTQIMAESGDYEDDHQNLEPTNRKSHLSYDLFIRPHHISP